MTRPELADRGPPAWAWWLVIFALYAVAAWGLYQLAGG